MPQSWQVEFTFEYTQHMLTRILVFEIEIDKMQGKWKLNQNHPEERRRRVVDVLKTMPDDNSQGIVTLMETSLEPGDATEGRTSHTPPA